MARTPASPPPMQPPAPMVQPIAPPPQVMQQGRKVTLLEAIAAASAGFGDLVKDSENTYLRSKYLGLPGLLRAVKPPLLEQGVAVYSQVMHELAGWVVRTTLAFVDGTEEIFSDFPIPDPSNQQKIGAIITYGTRYNLFALLAICLACLAACHHGRLLASKCKRRQRCIRNKRRIPAGNLSHRWRPCHRPWSILFNLCLSFSDLLPTATATVSLQSHCALGKRSQKRGQPA